MKTTEILRTVRADLVQKLEEYAVDLILVLRWDLVRRGTSVRTAAPVRTRERLHARSPPHARGEAS